jgi:hypothetical protein
MKTIRGAYEDSYEGDTPWPMKRRRTLRLTFQQRKQVGDLMGAGRGYALKGEEPFESRYIIVYAVKLHIAGDNLRASLKRGPETRFFQKNLVSKPFKISLLRQPLRINDLLLEVRS